jgi:uncharacterized protein affecting Mg2+/Co2+ transport
MRKNKPSRCRCGVPGWSALAVYLFNYFIRSCYVTIQLLMMYWPEQAKPLAERCILWFHLILLILMRQNIQSRWRYWIPGWNALAVVLFHYCIRSGNVTIQQPTMYLLEQAQPFADRFIPWFHLISLICMRKKIPSRLICHVLGWSPLAVVLFHYCIRSGYVPIQQPMMYWPEQPKPFVERYIVWFDLILLICIRKNIPDRWRIRVLGLMRWVLVRSITSIDLGM